MSKRCTDTSRFPKLFCILIIFAMSQLSLSLSAETESDSDSDSDNKTLLWPDGTRYVGGVKDGKRAGKGTIFWQDGTRFIGNFSNDQRNGPGTMILPDGSVYNGYFSNDVLVDPPNKGSTDNVAATSNALMSKPSPLDMDTNTPNIADNLPISSIQQSKPQPKVADQQVEKIPAAKQSDADVSKALDIVSADEKKTVAETKPAARLAAAAAPEPQREAAQSITPAKEVVLVKNEQTESTKKSSQSNDRVPLSFDANSLTVEVQKEVESTIDLWAAAWSEQNVNQYLTYYAADFVVPDEQSRSQWEAVRRARLTKPKSINISVTFEKIEMTAPNQINIQFNQTYRSNLYRDSTRKEMTLKKSGANWLIQTEKSL